MEANQFSDQDENLECMVVWYDEDSQSGEVRGWSELVDTSNTGKVQLSFGSSEYNNGHAGLSPGGEGSIYLVCSLSDGDRLFQYYVEEGRY